MMKMLALVDLALAAFWAYSALTAASPNVSVALAVFFGGMFLFGLHLDSESRRR